MGLRYSVGNTAMQRYYGAMEKGELGEQVRLHALNAEGKADNNSGDPQKGAYKAKRAVSAANVSRIVKNTRSEIESAVEVECGLGNSAVHSKQKCSREEWESLESVVVCTGTSVDQLSLEEGRKGIWMVRDSRGKNRGGIIGCTCATVPIRTEKFPDLACASRPG